MNGKRKSPLSPPSWDADQLGADIAEAIEVFRRERLEEPLEAYLEIFESVQDSMENLIEESVDLTQLGEMASDLLQKPGMLDSFRYLAGPPVSVDDLKVLIETTSLNPTFLARHPDVVRRLVQAILSGLDRRRFPWVSEGREPTDAEKHAAIIASAALIATQRVATSRRTLGKQGQEAAVRIALVEAGLTEIRIPGNFIQTADQAPKKGQFCGEVTLGDRRADLVVGLWDTRVMPIECKVSNSATNSVKRLNNDAASKAEAWLTDFGVKGIVPTAVLGGVYKRHNVENAQNRGLTIFWAHRLTDLTDWIEANK